MAERSPETKRPIERAEAPKLYIRDAVVEIAARALRREVEESEVFVLGYN